MNYQNASYMRVNNKHFAIITFAILISFTAAFSQVVNEQGSIIPNYDPAIEVQFRADMKSEGIPDGAIDAIVKQRKELMLSGRSVKPVTLNSERKKISVGQKPKHPVTNAVCSDMGGENGWGGWSAEEGMYGAGGPYDGPNSPTNPYQGVLQLNPTTPSSPRFVLTSGNGIEPCTPGVTPGSLPVPVVAPGFGNASIQLGEWRNNGILGGCGTPHMFGSYANGCAEQLTYALTVTPADTNFMYAYAVFIDEPNQASNAHHPGNAPYAGMCIYDSTGTPIPCGCIRIDQGSLANGFSQASCASVSSTPGTIWYKPWTIGGINLSQYIGQTLTIVLTNVDCAWGGHFAFSYWDFTCLTPVQPTPFCPGQTVNICAINGPPGSNFNYNWTVNGQAYTGPGAGTSCINPIPNPGDTFNVTIQQPSGCDFKMSFPIELNQVNAGMVFNGTCGQLTFGDSSSSSNPSFPVSNWNWQFPGGNPASSTSQNPGLVNYPPGNYTVTLIVSSAQGCPDTIQQPVSMGGFPTAAFAPTAPCLGGLTQLSDGSISNPGDPIVSWNWAMPGGAPASSTSQNTSTTYNTSGTHSVSLVVTTQNGCIDTIEQQVLVYAAPVANFSAPDSGCAPVCVNFSDLSTSTDGNLSSWEWTFPGGSPSSSTGQIPPQICYNTPGSYGVSLIVTTQYGCKDTVQLPMVDVFPWPNANFCVAPDKAPTTNPVFTFCDMWSSDVVSWNWNFGDNDSDKVSTDPVHSYSATATQNDYYTYQICLNVQNIHGCWDSICKTVELIPEFTFYIPNTFTPNGDWINEYFYGKCRGVKEYNIWLFDRWGNQIWDCHVEDKNTNWDDDGTNPKQEGLSSYCKWDGVVVAGGLDFNGNSRQLAQEDVYVWKVRLTDIFDKQHSYVGHVNIVR